MKTDVLDRAPKFLRTKPARGVKTDEKAAILRDGGAFGAGLIRQAAVITRGEAEGHGMWIDAEMLAQVHDAINAADTGTKGRFTHPDLSADGLGKGLGRWRNAKVDGDIVRADLHFFETAHNAPDGDLAEYVMDLAEEDPAAFGVSIVFKPDKGAEHKHRGEHSDDDGVFHSPDPDNKKNHPHARLAKLHGADVVDEPAANPSGLFSRGQEIAHEADALLAYSLGLSDERPELAELEIDPDRVSGFVTRCLESHGLQVGPKKEIGMDNPKKGSPAEPEKQPATIQALKERFPDSDAEWREGCIEKALTLSEARERWYAKLDADNKALSEEVAELKEAKAKLDKELFDLKAERAGTSPGTDPVSGKPEGADTPKDPPPNTEEAWKAEYAKSEALQAEFGSESTYLHWKRQDTAGNVRIKTG